MLLAHADNAAFLQQQLAKQCPSFTAHLLLKILWHTSFLNVSQILTTLFLV